MQKFSSVALPALSLHSHFQYEMAHILCSVRCAVFFGNHTVTCLCEQFRKHAVSSGVE